MASTLEKAAPVRYEHALAPRGAVCAEIEESMVYRLGEPAGMLAAAGRMPELNARGPCMPPLQRPSCAKRSIEVTLFAVPSDSGHCLSSWSPIRHCTALHCWWGSGRGRRSDPIAIAIAAGAVLVPVSAVGAGMDAWPVVVGCGWGELEAAARRIEEGIAPVLYRPVPLPLQMQLHASNDKQHALN